MEKNSAEILRDAAYEEGYKVGVTCGKLCAAQQILDELEEIFTEKHKEYKQRKEAHHEIEFPEADSYWLGRYLTCGDLLRHITELKKKHGVQI